MKTDSKSYFSQYSIPKPDIGLCVDISKIELDGKNKGDNYIRYSAKHTNTSYRRFLINIADLIISRELKTMHDEIISRKEIGPTVDRDRALMSRFAAEECF